MALVKCPDCGREVSTRAKSCPNCGCPSEFFPKETLPEAPKPVQTDPNDAIHFTYPRATPRDFPGKPRKDFLDSIMRGYQEPAESATLIPLGVFENEAILWRVLKESDGKTLLVAHKAIDCRPFHGVREDVTWSQCDLRTWLNGEFLNAAFDDAEREKICETTVVNPENPNYGTSGGPEAQDKVFCLSVDEARTYFEDDDDRICCPTDFAVSNGAIKNGGGASSWWLRTPGDDANDAALVTSDGFIYLVGAAVTNTHYAVRPAMWAKL